MRDQRALLNKCVSNDIPCIVISAKDKLAAQTIKLYHALASRSGCSDEFLEDLQEVIDEFEKYALDEPEKMKLPTLKIKSHY